MSESFERKNIGTFEFNLVRQSRKSPSIVRDSKDIIWVYVNHEFTESDVEIFVQRSSVQIAKLLEPNIKLDFDNKEIVDREEFIYLGTYHQLLIKENFGAKLEFDGVNFILDKAIASRGKELFREFYIQQAKVLIDNSKTQHQNVLGMIPKEILVCDLKDKWGLCTPSGTIKINWRSVMLPLSLFNYVVAHEFAHLAHLNHSGSFWRCLESLVENSKLIDRELEKYIIN